MERSQVVSKIRLISLKIYFLVVLFSELAVRDPDHVCLVEDVQAVGSSVSNEELTALGLPLIGK